MKLIKPRILLIGEAPGYKGCRLTGVPFTSEYILLKGIKTNSLFGKSNDYKKTDETIGLMKEATATIIWETLERYKFYPLLWNAFPFHPHKLNNPNSNRPPNKKELILGQKFIKSLISIFDIKRVIAIGNKAELSLSDISNNNNKVRHPSNGGKTEFVNGIKNILDN